MVAIMARISPADADVRGEAITGGPIREVGDISLSG
jgi:hypothetical protein